MTLPAFGMHNLTLQQVDDRNDIHLKIFVFEFVTGGGLYREPLPEGLAHEGDLMLRTLVQDLSEVPGVTLTTSRDARMAPISLPIECVAVTPEVGYLNIFKSLLHQSDAVWLIAPETGGILTALAQLVVASGKRLLGCDPEIAAMTSSKSRTADFLKQAGVDVIPVLALRDIDVSAVGDWVAKPDDGAGCEDTWRFREVAFLREWMAQGNRTRTHVVQPYQSGEAASLSMLCRQGHAWLLSCNRQKISVIENRFLYGGSILNAKADRWHAFEHLAQQIAEAMPGLAGYVGVDLMVDGDRLVVVEINPRLTTSYVGLREATGCNPARMVLDLFYNETFELPRTMARNIVNISLHE